MIKIGPMLETPVSALVARRAAQTIVSRHPRMGRKLSGSDYGFGPLQF